MDLVGDDLVVAAPGQLELDAVDGALPRRHDHAEEARHRADGPALHQQRGEHHDEGGVEDILSVGQAGEDRQDREQDRHRAAQADPGNERDLVAA